MQRLNVIFENGMSMNSQLNLENEPIFNFPETGCYQFEIGLYFKTSGSIQYLSTI